MPAKIITRVPNPAALLERAVDGLLPPVRLSDSSSSWPTLSAWIVLRQGGLRDDLHRLAAARGVAGWFDAPICLFTELAERWSGDAEAEGALSEPERHALLARLLEEHATAIIPRGGSDAWVPTVDRFIGELISEDIAVETFAKAAATAADDPFATQRAEALSEIFRAWHDALHALNRVDGRDARARLARRIAASPEQFAERLGYRREIRIVGLADERGGWRPLLAALEQSTAIDRLELLSIATDVAREPSHTPRLQLIEAADTARETERIAVEVRALLDGGASPSRIAVVARDARPAVDTMAAALKTLGVPVTARRRTALAHTAPARALLAILGVARESWSRHAVAELAEQPLLHSGLDAGIVNTLGFTRAMRTPEAWHEGLTSLLARAEAREAGTDTDDERRTPLPPSERVRESLAAWERIAPALVAMLDERSLSAWCAWCVATLEDDARVWGISERLATTCGDEDVWHRELRARERIVALLSAWESAASTFGGASSAMNATRFVDRLQLILAQDLITMPESDAGVVVAEALAAGWRAFDHVFITGLSAGAFPKRPVDGGLIDGEEREALRRAGLPIDAADAWRLRERALFDVLCAAASESLTVSWPALDGEGRETARSSYVDGLAEQGRLVQDPPEQVLTPGFPVARDTAAIEHARVVAARERERAALAERAEVEGPQVARTPWNGAIDDPELRAWLAARYGEQYEWSATQLETLAKCPWHWFAARLLKLEDRHDADDLLEPTVSGSLRHDALDRFFARARAERGSPVVIGQADSAWVNAGIEEALNEAWTAAESAGVWLGPPAVRATQRAEILASLLGYLAFEMKFNDDYTNNIKPGAKVIRSGAMLGEFRFEGVELQGDGVRFLLRGSVDRVDRGVDDRIVESEKYLAAIDYKSSKWSTPGAGKSTAWADGIVLQVPLYAAALQQRFPDDRVVRMEYRTLGKSAERVHVLSLAPVAKGQLTEGVAVLEAEEKLAGALEAAGRRVRAARTGELPIAPAPSAGCSPYCPARDICRIPGGPR